MRNMGCLVQLVEERFRGRVWSCILDIILAILINELEVTEIGSSVIDLKLGRLLLSVQGICLHCLFKFRHGLTRNMLRFRV